MKFKFIKLYNKLYGKKSNNYPQNDYYQYQDDNNQQVEVTQIIVDNDFDGKVKFQLKKRFFFFFFFCYGN